MTDQENVDTTDPDNDYLLIRCASSFALIPVHGYTADNVPIINAPKLPDMYVRFFINDATPGTPYQHSEFGLVYLAPIFGTSNFALETMMHNAENPDDQSEER